MGSHGCRCNPPAHTATITPWTRKTSGLGTPGCLVGYCVQALPCYLELPVVPVQLCSQTSKKLLANIVLVIKRLCDIIPRHVRHHPWITRPARDMLKYTGSLFHALFALIVILVSITVHCSIQKKSSLYQESAEWGREMNTTGQGQDENGYLT